MDIFFRLIRTTLKPTYTEGILIYRNDELCDTLEDTVRDINADGDLEDDGEGKIYGKTAIPYGVYKLTATYSPKFKKIMTLINDVPSFTGIRIHWGATPKQSLGCLLTGKKNGKARLANSGMTDKITTFVKMHEDRGDNVYLEII